MPVDFLCMACNYRKTMDYNMLPSGLVPCPRCKRFAMRQDSDFSPPAPRPNLYLGKPDLELVEPRSLTWDGSRGLVISPSILVEGPNISIRGGNIDPSELRYYLLFWDELAWPTSRDFHISNTPDIEDLISAGVMQRPAADFGREANKATAVANAHFSAFERLNIINPNRWSLASGQQSLRWTERSAEGKLDGIEFSLMRAIPIPDAKVPLHEVLEFRAKRRDELTRLRLETESLVSAVEGSEDQEAELTQRIRQLEKACVDLIEAGKSWKFPVRVGAWRGRFKIQPGSLALSLAGAGVGTWKLDMPELSAAIGGIAAVASIVEIESGDFQWTGLLPRSSPYDYVYHIHKELL